MTRNWSFSGGALALFVLVACTDDRTTGPAGQDAFSRYVAVGTSISMGVQSDGVLYSTQQEAWPHLLAHQAFAPFSQPLVQGPGCFSPFIAPLQLGRRLSGAAAPGTNSSDLACVLYGGIMLPTNDVAIDGASAYDALKITPESTATESVKRKSQYKLVLPAGRSQVTAMMMQNPTLVSVELGANEVLGAATSGLLIPAAAYRTTYTYVPNSIWQPVYSAVLDSVKKTGPKVLLVGVPNASSIVSIRKGDELYANRAAFQNFGVIISSDCNGSQNLVFVPNKVGTAVATARATGQAYTLSCTDTPGTQDYILTPADAATLSAVVDGMNSYIQAQATANGWAYLDANAVLAKFVAQRAPYSVVVQLSCNSPYGQYISLDGVHPNVQGHQEVANAAADALNAVYGFAIPKNEQPVLTQAQLCP